MGAGVGSLDAVEPAECYCVSHKAVSSYKAFLKTHVVLIMGDIWDSVKLFHLFSFLYCFPINDDTRILKTSTALHSEFNIQRKLLLKM